MDFPELRGSPESIIYPAWAEIKFDGEPTYVVNNDLETYFQQKNKIIPLKREVFNEDKSFIILGELICDEGKRHDIYKLLKINLNELSTTGKIILPGEIKSLELIPFDILELNGYNYRHYPFIERKEILLDVVAPDIIDKMKGKIVNSYKEAQEFFKEITDQGYEGIVLKNLNEPFIDGPCSWAKMKFKDESIFEISKIDPVKERIEVMVPFVGPMTTVTSPGRASGVKVMNKDKKNLKVGDKVKIEYQGILEHGGLRHPVFKGKAV